ncbi:MAG: HAD hydrolase-like protein, partial [Planctomycetota bacterium]|nr:HAD hydrolase-like protein [Planctomycetota bacterium]
MPGPQTQPARQRAMRGVIFDLDGVLVTTDEFHYRGWKELADELGLAFDRQVNRMLRGVSRQQSLRNIYAHNARAVPA